MEDNLLKAATWGSEAHKYQTRKNDKSSYFCHPLAVAWFLQDKIKIRDSYVLTAAILHDVVEDTNKTLKDVSDTFGHYVAKIVAEVSDDKSLSKADRKRAQLEHVADKSDEAKLVKAADMWHNLTTLINDAPADWTVERVQGYFIWKKMIYLKGIKGLNYRIDTIMDELFDTTIFVGGKEYPAIPCDDDQLDEACANHLATLN